LTPKRSTPAARTAATSARMRATGSRTMPRKPNPPARLTAVTNSARATPPMPASTSG
jgi:hypothetical protein